jgi:hypothetical protein
MWATLAALTGLTLIPAQTELKLTNARPTLGFLGATLKDGETPKLFPGDFFFVSFDIEGLQVNDEGKVEYSMSMEL